MPLAARVEDFFTGAAGKLLSEVEADPQKSNQHEFNGVAQLVGLLGSPPDGGRVFAATYLYLDDAMEPHVVDSSATWYDARARHPKRTEYRLYYPANEVMAEAVGGDFMVVARPTERHATPDRELVVVVAPASSTVAWQLQELFGIEAVDRLDMEMLPSGEDLTPAFRNLLEALGFEVGVTADEYLDALIVRYGLKFPPTREFSAYARESLPHIRAGDDPDAALLEWMDREEALYRTLERHIVSTQLESIAGDVDGVLEVAMKTFQRRRSRAGHALENHTAELLTQWGIPFESQAATEGSARPDFLIPSSSAYHNPGVADSSLRMLAVKTTCKDRWRQILAEAARIPHKHLLTLESPISSAQLAEMRRHSVTPIVPASLHAQFGGEAVALLTVRQALDELVSVSRYGR